DGLDPFAMPRPEVPLTPALVAEIEALPQVRDVTPDISLPDGIDLSLTLDGEAVPVRAFGGNFGGPPRFLQDEATGLLAGEEPPPGFPTGAVLVAGLADQLLDTGETYEDLV